MTHYNDITTYDVGSDGLGWSTQFSLGTFNLDVLDTHMLYSRHNEYLAPFILLLSQLLVGLKAVKAGGTILLALNKIAGAASPRILYILDSICEAVQTVKPRALRGSRSRFYVVAKEVRRDPLLGRIIQKLDTLRARLLHNVDYETLHWEEIWDTFVSISEITG